MGNTDTETTLQELKDLVKVFCNDRNWEKHNTPKNLAMSIAIEAAELMEHYQWDRDKKPDLDEVSDELADILFNLINFALSQDIDISKSFVRKYKKLQTKYPTGTFNNQSDESEDYDRIKKAYRENKE